jgi:predicted transcriptional regulator of viral defense system
MFLYHYLHRNITIIAIMVNTGRKTIVNLLEKTCGCGGFQEYQSPCAHAIVAARYYGDDPYIYFGWWHTLDIYCATS